MVKYHLNIKGEPGLCKAKTRCPFGGEDAHYNTSQGARDAFEKAWVTKTIPEKKLNPWADYSMEELAEIENESLTQHLKEGVGLNDEEYERRREYIRKISRGYPSTHRQFTTKVKGKLVYTDDRMKLQEALIENMEELFKDVPCEGKVLMSGGMPGAGKTTILKIHATMDPTSYATLNPDDIKELMAKMNMTPNIKAVLPLETDELIKYEAQLISARLYEKLSNEKKNLVVDKTMLRSGPVLKEIENLKGKGYESFSVVFADVDTDTAYERIVNRHRIGVDKYLETGSGLGDRVVPGSAIAVARTDSSHYKSKNAETLAELHGLGIFTTEPKVFDTSDGVKSVSMDDFLKE